MSSLVGSVNAPWGRVEIIKKDEFCYFPVMVHNSGMKKELPKRTDFKSALELAHRYVKEDPFKPTARLSSFQKIDADVSPGQEVDQDWDKWNEQGREIDLEQQRMQGGIKPMSEQFPGEEHCYSPEDSLESDKIREEIMRMKT